MFDVTPDDINQLNDVDLRELVGRLCEAELQRLGLSPAAVTWGGNQTAADGGLDVRVSLPSGTLIEGFVPRASTGFQVKKPDMPRAEIITEMRPGQAIRPVIQELADEAGAYIIVSSAGSTADSALRKREGALREALTGVRNAEKLQTEFYDRTRLATWVRCHSGLVIWVRSRVGRSLAGWQPYGPWSGKVEGVEAEYLLDDKLRLSFGQQSESSEQPMVQAIDKLRDKLSAPGSIVRLVGLSGVGKTRLVQALFDERIGQRPLSQSQAVYTNLSDDPDPQPVGMVSNLIANRMPAILIVDNCPPELHRRLSDLCLGAGSSVSVLTVEYDVRDDQPEGTQVVTLDTSSLELIDTLIQRRYPHLSQVDARTIAEVSGGNARIAIALADTVKHSESISGLSSEELFQRLFRQRHDSDNALLRAAQAFSLVYSFQGGALEGELAELPALAVLADQEARDMYRHVGVLLRRDLVQQRGQWRALLPHAIANRLAAFALEETPRDVIDRYLVGDGTGRLARSFSRRLSFLHEHPKAVAIAESWLAPGGLLGDVASLTEQGRAMFENIAPVSPEATLSALERVGDGAAIVWARHQSLLRSLAYDPPLFERSVRMLALAVVGAMTEQNTNQVSHTFESLFWIELSGTHASIAQRLGVIEELLTSVETKRRALGVTAMRQVFETSSISSFQQFDFGSRSRDYGYAPKSEIEASQWYHSALKLLERLADSHQALNAELRELLASTFRGLWHNAGVQGELVALFRRFSHAGFWREGWLACREVLHIDKEHLSADDFAQLSALENELKPSNTLEQVRAIVLGDRLNGYDLSELQEDSQGADERLVEFTYELATEVIGDAAAFAEILPELLRGGIRVWSFGRGLAKASSDARATWMSLAQVLEQIAQQHRSPDLFNGFLAELWDLDRELAQELLDSVLRQPAVLAFLPMLHSAIGLDERGIDRLQQAFLAGGVSIEALRSLSFWHSTTYTPGAPLKEFLLFIAKQHDGFDVALGILCGGILSNGSAKKVRDPKLLEVGQELLKDITFIQKNNHVRDRYLSEVVRACLSTPDAYPVAVLVAARLSQAVVANETTVFCNDGLFKALFESQPLAVLDALFSREECDERVGIRFFDRLHSNSGNLVDTLSSEALIEWCEVDCERRYPLAASFITFAYRPVATDPLIWSDHAKRILTLAPDAERVLAIFIERFKPRRWSGSRAALIEKNAKLLDDLACENTPHLIAIVAAAKARLADEILREHQWEAQKDRQEDERFE
ncbi:hypothetical protein ACW9IK_07060 [Pseudomonas gingeri]